MSSTRVLAPVLVRRAVAFGHALFARAQRLVFVFEVVQARDQFLDTHFQCAQILFLDALFSLLLMSSLTIDSVAEPGQWRCVLRSRIDLAALDSNNARPTTQPSPSTRMLPQRCSAAMACAESRRGARICPRSVVARRGVRAVGGLAKGEWYSAFDPADVLAGECRALLDRLFASDVLAGDRDATMPVCLLLPSDYPRWTAAACLRCATGARGFCSVWDLAAKAVTARLSWRRAVC